ncbi:MAG: bifunctional 5,10-methylene-tetrahydrofolate dehydrogenase/5,10-methylene-tetrahydrofolate cyclohydrolase [Flavobacteriaceae bacterium]|nr:bifunctional 5,10-methylene-tetrahydrofolate dehydrogenase/5,10-methylene-tetrahydrofolate cyclohydrolase [Flavobacteriaceae bacterium]|tara:strand:- start:7035 stop:7910 length:876 start_codon:yes stop_codon:yes gene_type:complete
MKILDGKKISQDIKDELKILVSNRLKKGLKKPHLAAIIVGNDGASLTYVGSKVKACDYVGYDSTLIKLEESITEKFLLEKINNLNNNPHIDGFIVQLPLPRGIDEQKILLAIDPYKDVDGFHPTNFGRMSLEMESFVPATPYGIIELLDRYEIETSGKDCVVIGRSNIVGRPISILLSQKSKKGNATVTLAHSKTKNLKSITKNADIIISALGIPGFLKSDMVKKGVVIIDVGITRVPTQSSPKGYIIKGDVDYQNVLEKSSAITPVPGGVGPMTISMLLKNTFLACQRKD